MAIVEFTVSCEQVSCQTAATVASVGLTSLDLDAKTTADLIALMKQPPGTLLHIEIKND